MTEDPRQARSTDQIGHHAIEIRERRRRVLLSCLDPLVALLTRPGMSTARTTGSGLGHPARMRTILSARSTLDP